MAVANPCSVPRALRLVISDESPEQQAACAAHDAAYERGGTVRDRALADARFLVGLLDAGMAVDRAHNYYAAVRAYGVPHWAGGYSDDPMIPLTAPAPEAP